MHIKSLVKELIKVPAKDILPHPMNWRTHPTEQLDTLRGLMAEIGFTTPVLVRKLESGQYQALDGHARIETLPPDHMVDCIVIDCDSETAMKILATHDPVSGMAGKDLEMLERISKQVDFVNPAVQQMLNELLEMPAIEDEVKEEPAGDEEEPTAPVGYQIIVEFESEDQQRGWMNRLMSHGLKCKSLTTT